MPIWLRKFTFHEINSFYQEEAKSYEKSSSGGKTNLVDSSGKVNTPAFVEASKQYKKSSYNTGTSKK